MSNEEPRTSDFRRVDPKALREQLRLSDPVDTESTGFLRFVVRLSEALNVDLPRQEHSKLATLAGCYDYLAEASPGSGESPNGY